MAEIEQTPNIGKELGQRLRKVGITTREELLKVGDAAAFLRIRAELPDDACSHTRLALAGAVRGVRWHSLDKALREALTREFKTSPNKV